MKDLTTALRLFCLLQVVVYKIDDLTESVRFKQSLKQKTNAYLKTVDTYLNALQRDMDINEITDYTKIVTEIDKLVETIEITQKEVD